MSAATNIAAKCYMDYNSAPEQFATEMPAGFYEFLMGLHRKFTPWQQELVARRAQNLTASHRGPKPDYLACL